MGAGKNQMNILVTGGGGFLGKAIVRSLVGMGVNVRSFSRKEYPELKKMGVEVIKGELAEFEDVKQAVKDCGAVFHVAAKAGIWGDYEDYYNTNVLGTKNVIDACKENGVKKLIYTSSPSVVFHNCDQEGDDESVGYPSNFLSYYPRTKAEAEQLVIEANSENLATVSLRPHLIWGPGDNHLVPRIIERAEKGQLRIVGDGNNKVDTVYIDNAAQAHILAFKKLEPGSEISGKTYFITNNEPLKMKIILNKILEAGGLPPVEKHIPSNIAYFLGGVMEFAYNILKIKEEPRMTRFLAKELSCAHWFDITSAERDLDYKPEVSIDQGMEKLKNWLQRN
ncbi:MAG: NAD-dependent epimerase/dehydratase family protein [Vulcanimicrobiota bacterium]